MVDDDDCSLLTRKAGWPRFAQVFGEGNRKLREVIGLAVLTLQFVLFGLALGFRCIFMVPLRAVAA